MIRFFCQADTSPAGLFALSWIPFMQALDVPIRIAAAGANLQTDHSGRSINPWAKHASLFGTPLDDGAFANVVCQPAREWHRHGAVFRRNCSANVLLVTPEAEAERLKYPVTVMSDFDVVVPTIETKTELEIVMARTGRWSRSLLTLKPVTNHLAAFRTLLAL